MKLTTIALILILGIVVPPLIGSGLRWLLRRRPPGEESQKDDQASQQPAA